MCATATTPPRRPVLMAQQKTRVDYCFLYFYISDITTAAAALTDANISTAPRYNNVWPMGCVSISSSETLHNRNYISWVLFPNTWISPPADLIKYKSDSHTEARAAKISRQIKLARYCVFYRIRFGDFELGVMPSPPPTAAFDGSFCKNSLSMNSYPHLISLTTLKETRNFSNSFFFGLQKR